MAENGKNRAPVLLAWPDLFPTNHAGAVRGISLASAIERLRHQCLIVTSADKEKSVRISAECSVHSLVLYDEYARHFPPPVPATLLPVTIARLASFAKKSGARVIISSTPGIFLSLEAYLVARLLRLGFILDVRDSWSLEMVTHEGKLRNLIKHWIEGIICRGASLTWTVTESLRTLLVNSHHLPPRKILVVPNGADLSKFSPGRGPKEYDFVFLGAPSPYRDVPRLLCGVEAWADRSPRLHGLWIGWREPSLSKEDLARLRRLVEKGVLVLKSPIPHEEVPALLQSAKIGIVSLSAHEVFRTAVGAKVYEYLATALALLCLGPPGDSELRRFVEGGKFGLFTTTPEEFATRGAQLVNNPEMLNEFSANCLAGAAQYDRVTVFRNALATPPNPLSGIS